MRQKFKNVPQSNREKLQSEEEKNRQNRSVNKKENSFLVDPTFLGIFRLFFWP